jgi:CheY-like chemotaxis protein
VTNTSERRDGPDRRRRPRGGRRPEDQPGFTPLVLVVHDDEHARELCEAILAKLRFAVTPAATVEKARQIMAALRPEIIVARSRDAGALRAQGPQTQDTVPVVEVGDTGPDAVALIEDIRAAIRNARLAER